MGVPPGNYSCSDHLENGTLIGTFTIEVFSNGSFAVKGGEIPTTPYPYAGDDDDDVVDDDTSSGFWEGGLPLIIGITASAIVLICFVLLVFFIFRRKDAIEHVEHDWEMKDTDQEE